MGERNACAGQLPEFYFASLLNACYFVMCLPFIRVSETPVVVGNLTSSGVSVHRVSSTNTNHRLYEKLSSLLLKIRFRLLSLRWRDGALPSGFSDGVCVFSCIQTARVL